MKSKENRNSAIVGKRVFWLSILITLVVISISYFVQTVIDNNNRRVARLESFNIFLDSVEPTLVRSTWQVNNEVISLILNSIQSNSNVFVAEFKADFTSLSSISQIEDDTQVTVGGSSSNHKLSLFGEDLAFISEQCDELITRDIRNLSAPGVPFAVGTGILLSLIHISDPRDS